MAQSLIDRRNKDTSRSRVIGKNWVYRFHRQHPALQARLTRGRDAQRVKNEDPRVIKPWFDLFQATRQKYGITEYDIYNFDETGFAMGLITGSRSSKVVTSSESVGRATMTQPGSRIWTTVIECINASGWALPPFVILEGKVHLEYWYSHPDLPAGTGPNLIP